MSIQVYKQDVWASQMLGLESVVVCLAHGFVVFGSFGNLKCLELNAVSFEFLMISGVAVSDLQSLPKKTP
jgi:hypothetical protein